MLSNNFPRPSAMAAPLRIVLLQQFLCCLWAVNAIVWRLNWTVAEVTELNFTLDVHIGDVVNIVCAPSSFSNIIRVAGEEQFLRCNVTTNTTRRGELRGVCLGRETQNLFLNIEEASAALPGDFGFVEGETTYFTSFSNGLNLVSANGDRTAGGECLDGLKITLKVMPPLPPVTMLPTEIPNLLLCPVSGINDIIPCIQECPLFHYSNRSFPLCIAFESNYIVQSNATSYHMTAITRERTGSITIPFTTLFDKNFLGEQFFASPESSPMENSITLNFISNDNNLMYRFASNNLIVPADLAEALPIVENIEDPIYGPTLVMHNSIIVDYTLSPPHLSPMYRFFVGLNIVSTSMNAIRVSRALFFSGTVAIYSTPSVEPLERFSDRPITCPGDVLSYKCSVYGSLPVTWIIFRPSQSQLEHVFADVNGTGNVVNLADGVSVVLAGINESFAEIMVSLTVLQNENWNGTRLGCSLNSALTTTITIEATREFANKPPPAPVNLRLTSHLYTDQNVTVVFEWDHDTSNIVDSYSISISPTPPSQPVVNEITSAIWNATLEYSIDYVVNVTAVNCGGRSRPLTELVNYGLSRGAVSKVTAIVAGSAVLVILLLVAFILVAAIYYQGKKKPNHARTQRGINPSWTDSNSGSVRSESVTTLNFSDFCEAMS